MKRKWILASSFLFFFSSLQGAITGPSITNNDYKVDISQTVASGSNRKVAMGGAYTSIAEGVSSIPNNPAGVAYRRSYENGDWSWDATIGSFLLTGDDYDNNNSFSTAYQKNRVTNIGGYLQYKNYGLGFFSSIQQYDVKFSANTTRYEFISEYVVLGRSFWERQFTLGLGVRIAGLNVKRKGREKKILKLDGSGILLGGIWQPYNGSLQVGLSYAGPVNTNQPSVQNPSGAVVVEGLIIPKEATMPVVGSLGVAYTWEEGEHFSRRPLTVSTEVQLIGKVDNANGIESFLEQRQQRSGEKVSYSFHVGSEWEVWPRRMRVRLGTYHEPSRFKNVSSRQHLTGGFEIRFYKIHILGEHHLSLNYAIDAASRYLNNFISLGFWHF